MRSGWTETDSGTVSRLTGPDGSGVEVEDAGEAGIRMSVYGSAEGITRVAVTTILDDREAIFLASALMDRALARRGEEGEES